MRILYGIQGTGHGHISRARVVLPRLREIAEVDVLISGYNYKLNIEGDITFKPHGVSLTYDDNGSVDILETAFNLRPVRFLQDMNALPVMDYDFVVNDYEPVSAWAAQKAGVPCVAISHQASFLSPMVPRPKRRSLFAEQILRHFAPFTEALGSHYLRYDDMVEPPIIRKQIKNLNPVQQDHITVYLPAYDHRVLTSYFNRVKDIRWHVFAPGCDEAYEKGNVMVRPVGKDTFLESLESCLGVFSSTGFETTSETMFLGKKLLTLPIRNQYEQLSNAAALERLGATVIYDMGEQFKHMATEWVRNGKSLDLPEITDEDALVSKIMQAGNRQPMAVSA